jgi:hypothetical protein
MSEEENKSRWSFLKGTSYQKKEPEERSRTSAFYDTGSFRFVRGEHVPVQSGQNEPSRFAFMKGSSYQPQPGGFLRNVLSGGLAHVRTAEAPSRRHKGYGARRRRPSALGDLNRMFWGGSAPREKPKPSRRQTVVVRIEGSRGHGRSTVMRRRRPKPQDQWSRMREILG